MKNKRTCETWYVIRPAKKQQISSGEVLIASGLPVQILCSSDYRKGKYLPFFINQPKNQFERTNRRNPGMNWKHATPVSAPHYKDGKKVYIVPFPN